MRDTDQIGPIFRWMVLIRSAPSAWFRFATNSFSRKRRWCNQLELEACTSRTSPLKAAGRALAAIWSPTAASQMSQTRQSAWSDLGRYLCNTFSRTDPISANCFELNLFSAILNYRCLARYSSQSMQYQIRTTVNGCTLFTSSNR